MGSYRLDQVTKYRGFAKPKPLRDPKDPLQKRHAAEHGKRLWNLGENEQLWSGFHRSACGVAKEFIGPATEATVKFVNAEVSLSCTGIQRYLGEEEERVHALRGVSLTLEAGTVHAVVGPSGCGKSTLLYILGLLDQPDAGTLTIDGQAVANIPDDQLAQKRNELLGFIFQFHFLLEDFSAQENVMIPMRRLAALSEPEMRARSAHLLDAVGLGAKLTRPSRHLSGGEQQRVAVARALANNPSVILADEPTGNLDSANSRRAFALLQKIVQDERKALLLVTHNPEIAEACDWIHEMQDGLIVGSHPRGAAR